MSGDNAAVRSFAVSGHRIEARPLDPGLYVVATPIGNLGDMTLRALATLAAADLLACEDTRVTSVLLRHYGIATRPLAYHDHNAAEMRPRLLAALEAGKHVRGLRAGGVHACGKQLRTSLPVGARPARSQPRR